MAQQPHRFQKQIVEVERIGVVQRLLNTPRKKGRGGFALFVDGLFTRWWRAKESDSSCFCPFAWLIRESAARYCMKSFSSKPSVR